MGTLEILASLLPLLQQTGENQTETYQLPWFPSLSSILYQTKAQTDHCLETSLRFHKARHTIARVFVILKKGKNLKVQLSGLRGLQDDENIL